VFKISLSPQIRSRCVYQAKVKRWKYQPLNHQPLGRPPLSQQENLTRVNYSLFQESPLLRENKIHYTTVLAPHKIKENTKNGCFLKGLRTGGKVKLRGEGKWSKIRPFTQNPERWFREQFSSLQ
jgi:hypothetical protein